jgi:hypothetical protein
MIGWLWAAVLVVAHVKCCVLWSALLATSKLRLQGDWAGWFDQGAF